MARKKKDSSRRAAPVDGHPSSRAGSAKAGSAKSGSVKAGSAKSGSAKAGSAKSGSAKPGSSRARSSAGAAKERSAPSKGKAKAASSSLKSSSRRSTAPSSPGAARAPLARRSGAAADPSSDRSGKYVYCIVQSTEPLSFGSIGIGAEPMEVYTIAYQDIAAVVSDTPLEVYDPTRENVLSHEGVNERVMHEYTVIPMSFGTVFKTADDIVELLRSAYSAFRDVLQKMENKLEFGLKVLWDPDEIIQIIEKDNEGLRRLREEILKQRGSTYFARMQYGRLVDSLLQERSEFYVREIFEGLRAVSVASRANKPIGERMIINAAFLVTRDNEQDFDSAVKGIGSRYPHLNFKYTGPWPPYNFVNIRLKLERAEDVE